jgi:HK97 family phage prohead protease
MTETISDSIRGPQEAAREPTGALRFREATTIGVSFPKRTIELIVTPYETETTVPFEGRLVTEIFSRGAYDGIERRPNRIRANRDHDPRRTVGRAVALHPSRQEGLVAELRIAQTELGDETLTLADDDCLDASAGYLPMPGGEQWEHRNRVRVRKAWLGHIALVPEPAYEGARVLAVRHQAAKGEPDRIATPHLDALRLQLLRDEYERLDARYEGLR